MLKPLKASIGALLLPSLGGCLSMMDGNQGTARFEQTTIIMEELRVTTFYSSTMTEATKAATSQVYFMQSRQIIETESLMDSTKH